MKAAMLLEKARRAALSARLLLKNGDLDGACNRAYFAMFDAARAALLCCESPVSLERMKTHNGLIAMFSLHLVKTGRISVELGRALNRAEELRLIGDYLGTPIDRENAEWAVTGAEEFVKTIDKEFICQLHSSGRPTP